MYWERRRGWEDQLAAERRCESGMSWGRPAAGSGCRDRLESGEKGRGSTENVATNMCSNGEFMNCAPATCGLLDGEWRGKIY
jgi:hypothetical protein